MTTRNKIITIIKSAQKKLGYTDYYVSKKSKVNQYAYSKMCQTEKIYKGEVVGEKELINLESVKRICGVLEINFKELLNKVA